MKNNGVCSIYCLSNQLLPAKSTSVWWIYFCLINLLSRPRILDWSWPRTVKERLFVTCNINNWQFSSKDEIKRQIIYAYTNAWLQHIIPKYEYVYMWYATPKCKYDGELKFSRNFIQQVTTDRSTFYQMMQTMCKRRLVLINSALWLITTPT